jgi:hypothetical protein
MVAKVLPRVILLRGRGERREAPAAGAITPGHLIAYNSAGSFVVHPTAGGVARPIYACERDFEGKGIDDAYASGDYVQAEELHPGCDVLALVAAGATAIARGAKLESAGNGTLRNVGTGVVIAEALEAVDNSAGGAAARIKVSVI